MAAKATLLVIDNNGSDINYLRDLLASKPYEIVATNNGERAFELLLQKPELYSAIILGQDVQQINALQLLYKLNSSSTIKIIPVIIEAATGSLEEMDTCIRAGARYCIPKPFEEKILPQIISAAIRDQARYIQAEQAVIELKPVNTLFKAEFAIKTLFEAQSTANLIAAECPNPSLAVVGLTEMLINAIEHGNLGINYTEKTKLHEKEEWLSEITRRLTLPENKDKSVKVVFDKSASHINIRITDQGNGFNWRDYQTLDAKRVFDNHGRGIVMARSLTFESLIYHGNGNDVECIIPLL
jgi:response regulator RpfG family c-di-GMP phosphodiesterase